MKGKWIACVVVCMFLLLGLSPGVVSAKKGGIPGGKGHYLIDLGGGGQYVFDLGGGGQYFVPAIDGIVPVVMPEGKVSRDQVLLLGDGEDNHIYLAEGQYVNILLPEGGGGQYGILYVPLGGGGQYMVLVIPFGGGGSYGLFVTPWGGDGQYRVHVVARGDGGRHS
jgi:hypothetical protein